MDIAIFAKFMLNGLIAGSLYAMLALGLSLLYGVLRFVNMAHGEYAITAAYCFYTFHIELGWPLVPSFLLGMGIFFLIVLIIEKLTFLPVRDGTAILMVEQNANMALHVSDRGYVLELGKNKFEGKGRELLEDERIGHAYLEKR